MKSLFNAVPYVWFIWGAVTAALLVLIVYGNTLSMREDDQFYLNTAEEVITGAEQRVLLVKMRSLTRIVIPLAVISATLFITGAGFWVWMGFATP